MINDMVMRKIYRVDECSLTAKKKILLAKMNHEHPTISQMAVLVKSIEWQCMRHMYECRQYT